MDLSLMWNAAQAGQHDEVVRLLSAAPPPMRAAPQYAATLTKAARVAAVNDHARALCTLLAAKARGRTARADQALLDAAVRNGSVSAVIALLEERIDPNYVSGNDCANGMAKCPLAQAAGLGHGSVMRSLLAAKALTAFGGPQPLREAAAAGFCDGVAVLLAAKADLDGESCTHSGSALLAAVSAASTGCVELLLSAKARTESLEYWTPLMLAVHTGQCDIVERLLLAGANTMNTGRSVPIIAAASRGDCETLRHLLAAKADVMPAAANVTPASVAAGKGHCAFLAGLLGAKADVLAPDGDSRTPMCHAAAAGNAATVQFLVAAKASLVERCCKWGMPPLSVAVKNLNVRTTTALLAAKADANMSKYGTTGRPALFDVARVGDCAMGAALLAAKADTDYPARGAPSPLCLAAWYGHAEFAQLLLSAGASVNAALRTDEFSMWRHTGQSFTLTPHWSLQSAWADGGTALFLAAGSGNLPVMRVLLNAKACARTPNLFGATPALAALLQGEWGGPGLYQRLLEAEWAASVEQKHARGLQPALEPEPEHGHIHERGTQQCTTTALRVLRKTSSGRTEAWTIGVGAHWSDVARALGRVADADTVAGTDTATGADLGVHAGGGAGGGVGGSADHSSETKRVRLTR